MTCRQHHRDQDDALAPAFFDNQRVEAASRYVYDSLTASSRRLVGRRPSVGCAAATAVRPADVSGFPVTSADALRNYTDRYRYDALGNIQTMRHIADSLGPDPHLRLRDIQQSLDGEPTQICACRRLRLRQHGSMSNPSSAPERFDLRWDWNDMIHTIDLGGGGRVWYQYAAGRQRCRKLIRRDGAQVIGSGSTFPALTSTAGTPATAP